MIRLIFCDVDGTLVQDNEQGEYTILVENLREINKTVNSGVHFALATGRPPTLFRGLMAGSSALIRSPIPALTSHRARS